MLLQQNKKLQERTLRYTVWTEKYANRAADDTQLQVVEAHRQLDQKIDAEDAEDDLTGRALPS